MMIDPEPARIAVLRGAEPRFLLPPPQDTTLRLDALRLIADGRIDDGLEILERIEERSEPLRWLLDGEEIEFFTDADEAVGGHIEWVTPEGYHWLPLEQVLNLRAIGFDEKEPYLEAEAVTLDRKTWKGRIPLLYACTDAHEDEEVRSGDATDLHEDEAGLTRGFGLRHWLAGMDEVSPGDFSELTRDTGRVRLL